MHRVELDSSIITPIVSSGIVFIDSFVDNYETLMAGVKPGLEVVLLDGSQDGIAQITQALKGRSGLSSVHIVAHGSSGELWVGSGFVNSNTLAQYSDDLQSWATALAPDADILIYGCNIAAGEKGQQFVQRLSQLTGADVAASNNLTGSAALGGDWELEVKIGKIEAPLAFQPEVLAAYNSVLPTFKPAINFGVGLYPRSLKGSQNADNAYGEAGNDKLYGGWAKDNLLSGIGDDYLEGNEDEDSLFLPTFLLTEQLKNFPTTDLESSLKAFVNWSLEQSYSNKQLEANLQILNCAWEAQKLLWKLRHS